MARHNYRGELSHLALALSGLAVITTTLLAALRMRNPTTAALSMLVVVLFTAAASRLWVAIAASVAAMLCLNFFFFPPFRTLTISDPQNWVALLTFLAVSLVAGRLSLLARNRQREALDRRDELSRLFMLSRDILLNTESAEAIPALARQIANRFELPRVGIYLPTIGKFDRFESGLPPLPADMPAGALDLALGSENATVVEVAGSRWTLTPLRIGTRAIGLLGTSGGSVDDDTLATLAGVAAIAIERAHFLEERKQAELAQRSAELKSTLLASLAHDLRTPLTAIRIAANNLQEPWLAEADRTEQTEVVLDEVARLSRLFQNILEMSTIDSGLIAPSLQWVHPLEIIEAAQHQVEGALRTHPVTMVNRDVDHVVSIDPRLTASALAHLLENAAHYSPPGSTITIEYGVSADGLLITVGDRGVGIAAADLLHLFDRYYRGAAAGQHAAGSGMGLAITRGLLAAEGGRVWAENAEDGGARFSLMVPAQRRAL